MKRIFLLSCFIVAVTAMTSCTNDDVETTPSTTKQELSEETLTDGQNGQTPTTPPKP